MVKKVWVWFVLFFMCFTGVAMESKNGVKIEIGQTITVKDGSSVYAVIDGRFLPVLNIPGGSYVVNKVVDKPGLIGYIVSGMQFYTIPNQVVVVKKGSK